MSKVYIISSWVEPFPKDFMYPHELVDNKVLCNLDAEQVISLSEKYDIQILTAGKLDSKILPDREENIIFIDVKGKRFRTR